MTANAYCTLLVIGSYLLGSVSSAILVTRLWSGKDIRKIGNRNAGVANVARSVGILPAAIVTVFDFGKGAVPVLVSQRYGLGDVCSLAGAVMAVVGHSFPLYFRFRGGKGLAAALGALLVFSPVETFVILPILGLVYLVITGSAVTGALISLFILMGLNLWRGHSLIIILAPLVLLVTMGLCAIPQILYDWRRRRDKGGLLLYWLAPMEQPAPASEVAVITDSIASLPEEVCAHERIQVIPLILVMPDGMHHDGKDLDLRQFYRILRDDDVSPKTSAPSPGEFLELYQKIAVDHEAAIVITPPKELTQTWESATLASEMISKRLNVYIVDSRTAGPAEGFVALAAARLAASGERSETILKILEKVKKDVGFVGVLDTLELLVKGGRVPEAQQWMKSALRVYPLLYIADGQIRLIGITRTKAKAKERMFRWLEANLPDGQISLAVCHTDVPDEAAKLAERLEEKFQPTESFTTELTAIIGAHAGAGLIGVAWWVQGDNSVSQDS
ncbi:MAG: glycerol-3-phosphate acyltransferase [Anaerolineales bacterium]